METIIVDPEMLTICRMCVSQKGKFHIVPSLQIEINECFNIKIEPFDGLSQIICITCKLLINEFYILKNTFREKQELLLQKSKEFMKNASPLEEYEDNFIQTGINESILKDKKNHLGNSVVTSSSSTPENGSQADKLHPQNNRKCKKISQLCTPSDCQDSFDESSLSDIPFKDYRPKNRNVSKMFYKYHCVYCSKFYVNRKSIKKHRENYHLNLVRTSNLLTKPCYISMVKLDSPNTSTHWVNRSKGEQLHYDCKQKHQYIIRCSYKRNASAAASEKIKQLFDSPGKINIAGLTTPESEDCRLVDADENDSPFSVTVEKKESSHSKNENNQVKEIPPLCWFNNQNNLKTATQTSFDGIEKKINILKAGNNFEQNGERKKAFKRIFIESDSEDALDSETSCIKPVPSENIPAMVNIPSLDNIPTLENGLKSENIASLKIFTAKNNLAVENASVSENISTIVNMLGKPADIELPALVPKSPAAGHPPVMRKKKHHAARFAVDQNGLAFRLSQSSIEVNWIGMSKNKHVGMFKKLQSSKDRANRKLGTGIEGLVPYVPERLDCATAHLNLNAGKLINAVSNASDIEQKTSGRDPLTKESTAIEIKLTRLAQESPDPNASIMTAFQKIKKNFTALRNQGVTNEKLKNNNNNIPVLLNTARSDQVTIPPTTVAEPFKVRLGPSYPMMTNGHVRLPVTYIDSLINIVPKRFPVPRCSPVTPSTSKAIIYPKPLIAEMEPVSRISINVPFPAAGSHISIDTPFPIDDPPDLSISQNASKNVSFIEEEPMIVETFSMSKAVSKSNVECAQNKRPSSVICPPRIKCKPTALLMPIGPVNSTAPNVWPWSGGRLLTQPTVSDVPCASSLSSASSLPDKSQVRPFTLLNYSMSRRGNHSNTPNCLLGTDERLVAHPENFDSERADPTCFLVGVRMKVIEVLKSGMCNLRSVNVTVLGQTHQKPYEALAADLLDFGIRIDERPPDDTEFTYLASMQVEYHIVSLLGVISFRRYLVVLFLGDDNIVLQVKDAANKNVNVKEWSPQWQSQLIRCLQQNVVWMSIVNTSKSLNFNTMTKIRTFMKCLCEHAGGTTTNLKL